MNNPLDFQNPPVIGTPQPPTGPKRWAALVGDYVKTGLILIFWAVVLFAALAGAFVACRAMYWGVTQILRALGGL